MKHIGEHLKAILLEEGLSQSELAKNINVPRACISDVIAGKRSITADTDLRLCKYLDLQEGHFLQQQANYRLQETKQHIRDQLAKIKTRKRNNEQQQVTDHNHSAEEKLSVIVLCGGVSLERGISLNSARSVVDHLHSTEIAVKIIYIDQHKQYYLISRAQLYSNTPADFDFKLSHSAIKLATPELIATLNACDLAFPVIHGAFGEDGELQQFLERHDIPFVGPDHAACKSMFHKHKAAAILKRHGYATVPTRLLHKESNYNDQDIQSFFDEHALDRAVIKPVAGGSSIGVFSADTASDAAKKCENIFVMDLDDHAIIEPFCQGKEFTIIVLQNEQGEPVPLIPTEIQLSYAEGQIFDYRRKYLPTANTKWLCPPHFADDIVENIRNKAADIFTLFGIRDFTRMDGWLLDNGDIVFTDLNPISGMEQNSFIFQQAARLGMTHRDLLLYIIEHACHRENIAFPKQTMIKDNDSKIVNVLFGGATAERQVSLMSGTNVWLKLIYSSVFKPQPCFLDKKGDVWRLPYGYALRHTVEEIYDDCVTAPVTVKRIDPYIKKIRRKLGLSDYDAFACQLPKKLSFTQFLEESKKENAFIFLALHGGEGEDGTIQQALEDAQLIYNGSNPDTSMLCMDKYLTGNAVEKIANPDVNTIPKKRVQLTDLAQFNEVQFQQFWEKLQQDLASPTLIIKPQNDGCSAGIIRLYSYQDLQKYIHLVNERVTYIPPHTFTAQDVIVEMAHDHKVAYMIEAFIETDRIKVDKNELIYERKHGWLELTVGVLERQGVYHALNPSITIANSQVLSLEEKFQGGTGINITPPPEDIISQAANNKIKKNVEEVSAKLGIANYARLDIFFNVVSEKIYVIEVNSLPALTPSTVIYHQSLAELAPKYPQQFLENLIDSALDS